MCGVCVCLCVFGVCVYVYMRMCIMSFMSETDKCMQDYDIEKFVQPGSTFSPHSPFPHPGSHPPGKNQLFLPSNLECLSDACSDNNPVVCRACASRGEGIHDSMLLCVQMHTHIRVLCLWDVDGHFGSGC